MKYTDLNPMARGYIDAMFFTDEPEDGAERDFYTFDNLAPVTLATILDDCAKFARNSAALLHFANDALPNGYSLEQAGHDLWLTRNHHGAGFWDRGLGDIGEALTKRAHALKALHLILGDDNKLYLEG